jgi:hypothetical protein
MTSVTSVVALIGSVRVEELWIYVLVFVWLYLSSGDRNTANFDEHTTCKNTKKSQVKVASLPGILDPMPSMVCMVIPPKRGLEYL